MSKLASLAKKRASQKQQLDQPSTISSLDRLQSKAAESATSQLIGQPVGKPIGQSTEQEQSLSALEPSTPEPSVPEPPKTGLSKLASRAAKSKVESSSKSALNSLRTRQPLTTASKGIFLNSSKTATSSTSSSSASSPSSSAPSAAPITIQTAPIVDYSTPFRKQARSFPSRSFGSLLKPQLSVTTASSSINKLSSSSSSSLPPTKKQRTTATNSNSNFLYPLTSSCLIQPAFSNPSPDDIVTDAQTHAKYKENETRKSFSGLRISGSQNA